MPKYFGTDGIRGKSPEWLNSKMAYRVGYALGVGLNAKRLLIGRDTRESGFLLNKALNQGAIDSGVKTINFGVVSTPMVQYLSLKENAFGIMITASHNPASDNGIKVIQNGKKISYDQEIMLEKYVDDENLINTDTQNLTEDKSLLSQYFNDLNNQFNFRSNCNVYLDTANGSLSSYAKDILSKFANIKGLIGNEPNGFNINENIGSTHIVSLLNQKPLGLIGLAFDGDGDRLVAVDEKNEVVTGDIILSVINDQLKIDSSMVFTKMLNPGIKETLNDIGINTIETNIGDKYIKQALDEYNFLIGGEDSGHMIFKNLWPVGDGLFSAILLLKALSINNMTLHEASKIFTKWPEELINIKGISKESFLSSLDVIEKIEVLKKSIMPNSKLLIRPSGTEPVIRIYVSHKNRDTMKDYKNQVIDLLVSLGGKP